MACGPTDRYRRIPMRSRPTAIGAVLLAYAAAAFYPFRIELPVRNRVERGAGGPVHFPDRGVLRSEAAPGWVAEAMRTHAIEISLEVKPALIGQAGPARILTLSKDARERNFTVAQRGKRLVFRLRHPEASDNGIPPFRVEDVFGSTEWRSVRIRIAEQRLRIEVDGEVRLDEALPPDALGMWDPSYPLALGNELTGRRAWLGSIRKAQVRVGPRTTDYVRTQDLYAPFWVRRPVHWEGVPFELHFDLRDILLNLLGFLPFGALLAWRGSTSILRAALWSGLWSLLLETGQLAFAARNPSVQDWVLNIVGGALGAWWAHRRLAKRAGA